MKTKHLLISAIFACGMHMSGHAQPSISFRIETSKTCQTMDSFGASDAWTVPFVGLWPEEKLVQVADWLFSTENDENGQPKGIGLSLWRFNVGAGSTEQGEESRITPAWKRTECFLTTDGTYDWEKQTGQRNLLKLAKERGVGKFLAFLNSPPVYFTQNGLATNTGRGGTANLKPDCYEAFAGFLADVVQGVEKHDGVKFHYVSPFNEPDGHWNWTGSNQEGSPATNREIAHAVRLLSKEFTDRKMDTQIVVNEASDYRCMFGTRMTDWQRGYHIQSFFNPDSVHTYLGDLPNVPRLLLGHSYWTNTPLQALRDIRCQLRDTLDKYNVELWQSETCIMSNDTEVGGSSGAERSMKTALYVARIIHHDIVYARARSWQWWRAIGGGCLIYEKPHQGGSDGDVEDSKLLWVLGNYSRFIRPGAVRLAVSASDKAGKPIPEGDTDPKGLMCSAYKNTDGSYATVIINYADTEKEFSLSKSKRASRKKWKVFRTSDKAGENLKPIGEVKERDIYRIPARSVITLLSD